MDLAGKRGGEGFANVQIAFSVSRGYVTLEGTVDWPFKKDAAAEALNIIVGIKGIKNCLLVKPHADANDSANEISTDN